MFCLYLWPVTLYYYFIKDLLTDVVDIVLHCVDQNHLKQKPLQEVFPPIQTFHQVRFSFLFHYLSIPISFNGQSDVVFISLLLYLSIYIYKASVEEQLLRDLDVVYITAENIQ